MKKWIALFLSAAILMTAAGCGGNGEQPSAAAPSNISDETPPADYSENSTDVPPTEGAAAAVDVDQLSKPDNDTTTEQPQKPAATPENPLDTNGQQSDSQP